ncbi:hypothetical protein B0J11DRAFT_525585 [Dendryphion nanum]|uniref:Zn(2)-C6 fungal-type domain-containing protein n=1 Tax=Dendryphion nanum TaxID=256645 RepID=A0A9P9IRS0_9PLEO|nr:hypothetical protein B0J11DRAFT_525585 [Dendryphion nanum]
MADNQEPHEDGSRRPLRLLLPVSREAKRRDPVLPPKRPRTSAACSACRSRKTRCSAERPKCGECISRHTSCEYAETHTRLVRQKYNELRNQQDTHKELVNLLVAMPEDDSLDLLRRIRAGDHATYLPSDPPHSQASRDSSFKLDVHESQYAALKRKNEQLEQQVKGFNDLYKLLQQSSERVANEACQQIRQGMPLESLSAFTRQLLSRRSPSPNRTNRSILPPTNTPVEFQLVALHPNAYPALSPLDVGSLDLRLLGITPLTSFRHHNPASPPGRRIKDPILYRDRQPPWGSPSARDHDALTSANPLSSEYIDPRLNHIRICRWTHVAITDDLASRVVSLYLLNDTSWWAYFDIDLFLEDLANGKTRFCSQLLVNSILAWACQAYAYFEPTTFSLASNFLDEASYLYESVKHVDSLTTVAATSLMCMAWTALGNDTIGMVLLAENASMAERLHLYNVLEDAAPSPLDLRDNDMNTAAAATAWGSFNLQMLLSMSYRRKPFAETRPNLPMPGESSTEGLKGRPLPYYQGQIYTSVCKLWSIAFEMNCQYFCKDVVSLTTAELIFQRLLAWADDLQGDIKRGKHTADGVTNLHIWFHTIVLDVFRPFADLKPQPKLTTFAENNATPENVVNASIKQLKRLIYNYRATSQSADYSIIWHSGMLYLINHILNDYTNNEAHFYFLLCMRGYQNLARTIPWIGGVMQSIAAMAVRLGTILPEDALNLFKEINSEGELINRYMSTYPVDLYHSAEDPFPATLEHLVDEFRRIRNVESEESEIPQGWNGDSVSLFTTLLDEGDMEVADLSL